jgi:hypothetical protein
VIEAENIRDWRGHNVIDPDGDKIGELEAVYVDTGTDEPSFATVRTGLLGHQRLLFVPLTGSTVGPGWLKVAYSKKTVRDAPSIDVDGELEATAEPQVFEHYGLAYERGAGGERKLGRR